MQMRVKLQKVLDKIGTTNGTAPETSQDPNDAIMHEYNVCTIAASYFDKRREKAKTALLNSLSIDGQSMLENTVKVVNNTEQSSHVLLSQGQYHDLDAHVKTGASYLDEAVLRVEMLKLMPTDVVERIFASARKRRSPSVTYNVIEKT